MKTQEINIQALEEKALWLRQQILKMTCKAGAGHVAPSMSCADILVALHQGGILRLDANRPRWEDRDRFILSKGQAAVALYAVLADLGYFPTEELYGFTQQGSRLGGHTEDTIPGVEAFTGSLGHGLPLGAGLALTAQRDKKEWITVVLHGDGECHEGSVWEAAMFAAQHKLNNLIVIVDRNGLSATDFTEKSVGLEPLDKKWESFGWEVKVINGHSMCELMETFSTFRERTSDKPLAIIAKTVKGKGLSFMENKPIWHYRIPADAELVCACKELGLKETEV